MPARPPIVLVHGFWHDQRCWARLTPALERNGHPVHTLDLAGAGVNAREPDAYRRVPFDPQAFATEPSPNTDASQQERTRQVVDLVAALEDPVVLVGHSFGGRTVSEVAEAIPDRVRALVFLTAVMLPPGETGISMNMRPEFASSSIAGLLKADPELVGAYRVNPRSQDPADQRALQATFCGDLGAAQAVAAIATMHPDEPAEPFREPLPITPGRFGRVPRHYIVCTEDRAMPVAGQLALIEAVDAALGSRTIRHHIRSSHSPFLSQPDELARMLTAIGAATA